MSPFQNVLSNSQVEPDCSDPPLCLGWSGTDGRKHGLQEDKVIERMCYHKVNQITGVNRFEGGQYNVLLHYLKEAI